MRLMMLPVNEFLRRFLLHVLPPGFVRIRHFGFLALRRRGTSLPRCFQLLAESGIVRAASREPEKTAPCRSRFGLVRGHTCSMGVQGGTGVVMRKIVSWLVRGGKWCEDPIVIQESCA
jgi:hypothetical protein